ncbi:hypothetical protein [Nonomuraea sp. B19D2]|uniref:hypothetical protein n=1 Tax=Nonomuraea sp. B19D2 TaxID=3159561 RepID=UPI0032DAF4C2
MSSVARRSAGVSQPSVLLSGRRGRRPRQGLVRRVEKAPWIPNEWDWQKVLQATGAEPLRNRLMLALAYDGALRREELVHLEIGDFEPAYCLAHRGMEAPPPTPA